MMKPVISNFDDFFIHPNVFFKTTVGKKQHFKPLSAL